MLMVLIVHQFIHAAFTSKYYISSIDNFPCVFIVPISTGDGTDMILVSYLNSILLKQQNNSLILLNAKKTKKIIIITQDWYSR